MWSLCSSILPVIGCVCWKNVAISTISKINFFTWHVFRNVVVCCFFYFLEDISLFVWPLISLFWTSCDVSSGFQSQNGQLYLCLTEMYMSHVLFHIPSRSQNCESLPYKFYLSWRWPSGSAVENWFEGLTINSLQ